MKDLNFIHPIPAVAYFTVVILTSMFVMHPVFIMLSLIGAICTGASFGGRQAFSGWKFYIIIFILTALINPLVVHRGQTVMFYIGLRAFTFEALVYGLAIAGVLISVLLWFKCMGYVLTDDKFMYLFGKALPKTALVISIIMGLIPMFVHQIKNSLSVQRCMGLGVDRGLIGRIKTAAHTFSANISRALEEAVETAASMRARCYGTAKRTSYSLFSFKSSDAVFTVVISALSAIVIVGIAIGAASFSYYPVIDNLRTDWFCVAFYIGYGLLLLLPSILWVVGRIRWKYCISTI